MVPSLGGQIALELSGNLSARTQFFRVPGKSGTPAPAPAAKDGTILEPFLNTDTAESGNGRG
jgi:hypothetical protein